MNWQTYLPTPAQIEADKALVDAALNRLTNFVKIQFDGMTGGGKMWALRKSNHHTAMKYKVVLTLTNPIAIAAQNGRATRHWHFSNKREAQQFARKHCAELKIA